MADEGRLTLILSHPAVCQLEDTVVFYTNNGCLISFADELIGRCGIVAVTVCRLAGNRSDRSHDCLTAVAQSRHYSRFLEAARSDCTLPPRAVLTCECPLCK